MINFQPAAVGWRTPTLSYPAKINADQSETRTLSCLQTGESGEVPAQQAEAALSSVLRQEKMDGIFSRNKQEHPEPIQAEVHGE